MALDEDGNRLAPRDVVRRKFALLLEARGTVELTAIAELVDEILRRRGVRRLTGPSIGQPPPMVNAIAEGSGPTRRGVR